MSFNPNQDHSITLAAAAEMTKDYRNANPGTVTGGFFGKTAIQAILDQPNCVGLKIYFAQNASGERNLVITGTKANQEDLYNGALAEEMLPEPPYQSLPNPLNS